MAEEENTDISNNDSIELHELIEKARSLYNTKETINCPFFKGTVTLNSDGFNHLLNKPNRQPRNVNEQMLKLKLLKRGLETIRMTGTVQEYRVRIEKFGKPARDGFTKTKNVEYWAFHNIVGEKKRFLIRVIARCIGDGKVHFWSVMPHGRINQQKLYREGIEEG